MTLRRYQEINLSAPTMVIVDLANEIIEEYQAQSIALTLRALYYRFVARYPLVLDPGGEEPNTQQNYKRLGSILNRARLAGHVSWDAMVDRTRNLEIRDSWYEADEFLQETPDWFHYPMWDNQTFRPFGLIEKDAGLGTIEAVCRRNDVPFMSCRGNMSQSEMWALGQRFAEIFDRGQIPCVFYLGDHDPSGVDMTRDVTERLEMFAEQGVEVTRLLLNLDQIDLYQPPPNPVKGTDSRSGGYRSMMEEAGYDPETCWEMDALDPSVVVELVQAFIDDHRDLDAWNEQVGVLTAKREEVRALVRKALAPEGGSDAEA